MTTRWEARIDSLPDEIDVSELEKHLAKAGEEGWEPWQLYYSKGRQALLVHLKREKQTQ